MCIRDSIIALAPQYFLNHFNQDRILEDSLLFTLKLLLDSCLLYTSDAADERSSVDLGGRRIIKKKK